MFEYCKVRYVDPSNPFFGTVDYAVRKEGGDPILFYSIVRGGPVEELRVQPAVSLREIVAHNELPVQTLPEIIELVAEHAESAVEVSCNRLTKEGLRYALIDDMSGLPEEIKDSIRKTIAEAF